MSTDYTNVEQTLLERIQSASKNGIKVDLRTQLIFECVIDSFDILTLIEFIEDRFQIALENDDLHPEHFETVEALSALVRRKMSQNKTGIAGGK